MDNEPIYTPKYLREVEGLDIRIHSLPTESYKTSTLWEEVEELLADNDMWYEDDDYSHDKYVKNFYAITTKRFDFDYIKKENKKELWMQEIHDIIDYKKTTLYRYMYEPAFCDNYYGLPKYSLNLPIDRDECRYCYIIILLSNNKVIIGRHGYKDFGYEKANSYYFNDVKQVDFDELEEPFKSLIEEKQKEEKEEVLLNMEIEDLTPNYFNYKALNGITNYFHVSNIKIDREEKIVSIDIEPKTSICSGKFIILKSLELYGKIYEIYDNVSNCLVPYYMGGIHPNYKYIFCSKNKNYETSSVKTFIEMYLFNKLVLTQM